MFGDGEGGDMLLPPQTKPLDEYFHTFAKSQKRTFE